MGGAYSTYWRDESCIQILFGKPEGKRPFGRIRSRWEDGVKML